MVQKIKALMDERGLRQKDFEKDAGLPKGRFSKWLGGQGEPTASQAFEMAKVLGVPIASLMDDQQDTPPSIEKLLGMFSKLVRTYGPEVAYQKLSRITESEATSSGRDQPDSTPVQPESQAMGSRVELPAEPHQFPGKSIKGGRRGG